MGRYPRISDYVNDLDSSGNKICRNCSYLVVKGRRHYCSSSCMQEFFRDHKWSLVREDILRRDGFRCSICLKKKRMGLLQVDHIIPVRMGIDVFEKKNLRTLCKECHVAKSKLDRSAIEGNLNK